MPGSVPLQARPLVAIPGRFSASASALRYRAVVVAQALAEAVFAAGGEPLLVLPHDLEAGGDIARRLAWADALLLPGGGDLDPSTYVPVGTEGVHAEVYDVDPLQDAFDLAAARWALARGVPLLAVCRGMQVVNVALGGTLNQHVEPPHRHFTHPVDVAPGSALAGALGSEQVTASCYHHQTVDQLGAGLVAVASAADGTIEGVERPGSVGWFVGVQWHPEDTATGDAHQRSLLEALIAAAAQRRAAQD